jgi:N-acetylglucosaminyldiphosphoundecaprenol N-acetyl-beta-D-mannosaminyltransferase
MVSPYEARAAMGLRYGDPPVEEARYERGRSAVGDAAMLLRWLAARVSHRAAAAAPAERGDRDARPFIVSSRVDAVDTHEAVATIVSWVRRREPGQVFFVHPHALNLAAHDETLRADIAGARLVLPDGIGIRIAAAILGVPLPANVNGTDLVPELLLELAADRIPIALIGGAPGVAQRAADTWHRKTRVPIAGVWDGFGTPAQYRDAARTLVGIAPCVVFIGMGSPKQERFTREYFSDTPGVVAVTVGGLFDFESGSKPRAPLNQRSRFPTITQLG